MRLETAMPAPDDAGSSTSHSHVLTAALDLAGRGFSVFPVNRDKKPLAGMHGFQDATRDEAAIRGWFANAPGRQLAVATGNGLLVVDLVLIRPDGHIGFSCAPPCLKALRTHLRRMFLPA